MAVTFPAGTHPLENELNKRVLAIAAEHDYRLYIVGGFIRDALLNKRQNGKAKDIDYAVDSRKALDGSAMKLAAILAQRLDGHLVPLDETNDTVRVVVPTGEIIDFAGCVGGTIEADVQRRDFTINALVWSDDRPDEIVDLVGGMSDIPSRTIRLVSEKSITDDPLRMLRAFRFSATLEGRIDDGTIALIKKHASLLANVAVERINYELFLTTAVLRCAPVIELMAATGLLEVVFAELIDCRKVTANAFHHLGLFEHSVETIPQLEAKLDQVPDWVMTSAAQELSAGVTRLAATKVACLLHDIGKPQTWAITEEGRHTFYGHDKLGADMCVTIGERMKWSRPVEKLIVNLVRWHLRPGQLYHQGPPTDKAIRRFYRSVRDDLPELMLLAFADFGATRGPGLMGENRIVLENSMFELLAGYLPYKEETANRPKLLNGTQIMELLSLKAGPAVGELLAALEEAQEFKEVSNRTEAERFVKDLYQQKYSK
jgi:putative nucleotidyltransferase with HDIG domain